MSFFYNDDRYLRKDPDYQGGMRPADWEGVEYDEREFRPITVPPRGLTERRRGDWNSQQPQEWSRGGSGNDPGMQRRSQFRTRYESPMQAAADSVEMEHEKSWYGQRRDWPAGNDADRGAMEMGAGMNQTGPAGRHTGRGPRGYQRADSRIQEEVCEALTRNGWVDATDIEVIVQGGEVSLRGMVDDRQQKRQAEAVAEGCSGVRDVHNQIRVRGSQARSSDTGMTNAVLEENKAEDLRPARSSTRGSARAR